MEDCIFCKIAEKKIPSTAVYEDDKVLAFKDADPQAPTHVLIIPKTHIKNILEVAEDSGLMNHIFGVINKLADELGLKDAGFRVVANTGEDGGQTVEHLHFHLLGGRKMSWPPG